jgi:hypothetical protein
LWSNNAYMTSIPPARQDFESIPEGSDHCARTARSLT